MIDMVQSVVTGKAEPADALEEGRCRSRAVQVSSQLTGPRALRARPLRLESRMRSPIRLRRAETDSWDSFTSTQVKKFYGHFEVLKGVELDVRTASSSSSSARPVAASRPCCG